MDEKLYASFSSDITRWNNFVAEKNQRNCWKSNLKSLNDIKGSVL